MARKKVIRGMMGIYIDQRCGSPGPCLLFDYYSPKPRDKTKSPTIKLTTHYKRYRDLVIKELEAL